MTQGSVEDERAAVQRTVDLGVNYFDTAPNYGARVGGTGVSERHLGQVLRDLSIDPIVGSKVEFSPEDLYPMFPGRSFARWRRASPALAATR